MATRFFWVEEAQSPMCRVKRPVRRVGFGKHGRGAKPRKNGLNVGSATHKEVSGKPKEKPLQLNTNGSAIKRRVKRLDTRKRKKESAEWAQRRRLGLPISPGKLPEVDPVDFEIERGTVRLDARNLEESLARDKVTGDSALAAD